jgi:hypothetical protein
MNLSTESAAYTSPSGLINVASIECSTTTHLKRVDKAGSSSSTSYLVNKLTGVGMCGTGVRMPKGGTPFTPAQMNLVTTWIDAGAVQ